MNDFPCFQNENRSHLCQENGGKTDWNSKWCWITFSASRTKTKVIDVKKITKTWIEMAKCYDKLLLLPEGREKSFMSRKLQKHSLKKQSVTNNFSCFQNKNKSHLRQENGRNMVWNRKYLCMTSPSSATKTKVIYAKRKAETWIEMAKCYK